ncbi:MAG: 1-acyl-sn-glycerol-3-phosphate acyltransferase [Leptospira sp.]|nr:1-acyl-sn-glycerol-3-phosphate acyltransferase [Leptospira sp.]
MSMNSFIPPKFNYPFLWFTDFSLPFLFKLIHNLESVEVSDEDRALLKTLKNERLIVISNHPTTKEPPVIYTLANIMSSRFHYMASREVFDWAGGFVGEFIQSIGAYSVIAGTNDRDSLKATRNLLASPGGKLALFPEGEPTSGLNDTLLPFQPGIAQLGFWGMEDAIKKDPEAKVQVLPCFIKYKMSQPKDAMQKDMDRSLEILENKMGITKLGKTITQRFQSIGRRLIEKEEREYGIVPEANQDYNFRLGRLRHTILDNVAKKIELAKYDKEDNAIVKLRKILSFLELVNLGLDTGKEKAPSKEVAKWARTAAQRAYDSISMQVEYIEEHPCAERLYEWLYRFETEVLGETKNRPHIAKISLSQLVNLKDYLQEYKQDKKGTVQVVTNLFRERMDEMLHKEISDTELLYPPGYTF